MSLREKINALGAAGTPFVFCINYDKTDGFVYERDKLPNTIKLQINGQKSPSASPVSMSDISPISFAEYEAKISAIKEHIRNGDIYMANLTCETKIELDGSLDEIFESSSAPFKLLVDEHFVVHSPEEFVSIEDGKISTYPMKGTALYKSQESIDTLLADQKELAEHTMVVDLLRNDISIVANSVSVDRFRYPTLIEANGEKLIQTISHISGVLADDYQERLGDILFSLLPAGSITGTPKRKCVEVLEKIEGYDRGFYCGIFGEFDGKILRSAVAIRYIEKKSGGFVYKSGGGITDDSDAVSEYEEMIKKVYLAF